MPTYEAGLVTAAASSNAPYYSIQTANYGCQVKQIEVICTNTTSSSIGLYRCGSTAPVETSPVAPQPHNVRMPTIDTKLAWQWSTPPTRSASPVPYKEGLLASTGNGVVWTFPDPIPLEPGGGTNGCLLIWNDGAGAGSILRINVILEA